MIKKVEFVVAIPFDPGQVSTHPKHQRILHRLARKAESQSLLIQGRFQHGKNDKDGRDGHNFVAIPFDPGQVSTR